MSMLEPLDVLRVAVAAARASARVSPSLLRTLDTVPPVSGTWSDETREAFVELLDSGPSAIAVVESLDHGVSWSRLIPEWNQVRSRIQRNALHRFTVDRHLLETASEASQLSTPTRRDLLLVAALLHDIGKGSEGDHSEVGERVAREIATRMGFPPEDVSVIAHAVRHHLLLPDVATRRDLDDPATVGAVAGVVGTTEQLSLLRALAQADGVATGPSAWTQWRAQLVDQLTNRVAQVITGAAAPTSGHGPFPTAEQRGLLELGGVQIRTVGDAITVACPDRPGVFHRVAGVLALHGLDVLSAAIHSEGGMALDEFRVGIGPSGTIPWERVTDDVAKVLEGRLAVHARLDERVRTRRARRRPGVHQLPQAVRFDDDASEEATVLEVTGADSIGLLYRLTRALTDMDIDIRTAKIHTMGADVVDTFYVVTATGDKVTDDDLRAELRRALLHALEPAN